MRRRTTDLAPVVEHGQVIYAYCHIRTNQVIYSLTRRLNNAQALRQLPDLGANHKPASLRKDLWRPLYTLRLPPTSTGSAQGLHAFKRLHEHRKTHEICWTPSPLLSRPYDEEHIEKLKKKLEQRGGAKEESVYDVIKRLKKKMRVKEVLDQKARSVADLAAVLAEQEGRGEALELERVAGLERDKRRDGEEMVGLARRVESGGEEVLAGLRAGIVDFTTKLEAKRQGGKATERDLQHSSERLQGLKRKLGRMEFAPEGVRLGRQRADEAWEKEVAGVRAKKEQRAKEITETGSSKISDEPLPNRQSDYIYKFLPDWPEKLQYSGPAVIPKGGFWRNKFRNAQREAWPLDGTTVSWANPLDAEYAADWPEAVVHDKLGYSRNTAPKFEKTPAEEAIEEVEASEVADAVTPQAARKQPAPRNRLNEKFHRSRAGKELQRELQTALAVEKAATTTAREATTAHEKAKDALSGWSSGEQQQEAEKKTKHDMDIAQIRERQAQRATLMARKKVEVLDKVKASRDSVWEAVTKEEKGMMERFGRKLESKEEGRVGRKERGLSPVAKRILEKVRGVKDAGDAGSAVAEEPNPDVEVRTP